MKLTVKTLKGEIINVQIEPEQTIGDLKQKVKDEKGLEVEFQKIVFKGKQTNNADTISQLGIKQNDFLVVMNLVKKPESKPKQENVVNEPKAKVQNKEQKQDKKEPKIDTPSNEAQILELMNMGFDREKCVAALRAAFNDSQRAVDYLLNGIPSNLSAVQPNNQLEGGSQQVLRALMSTPEFASVREVLREDPSQIASILQQIMITSPPLYNMISQNPEAFQRILEQDFQFDDEEGDMDEFDGQNEEGQGNSIQLSQAEDDAINRLVSLGFSKIDAAQAYFACDKNQEMAANLLFQQGLNNDIPQGNPPGANDDEDDDNLFG